jgi:hypothetical protein
LKPYQIRTDVQAVVVAYKVAIGLAPDDRLWDKGNFARGSKTAKALIDGLGSAAEAMNAINGIKRWAEAGGFSWTLETVLKRAAEWRIGRIKTDQEKVATPLIGQAKVALKRIDEQMGWYKTP